MMLCCFMKEIGIFIKKRINLHQLYYWFYSILVLFKVVKIPFKDALWLSCKYARLVTVDVGLESTSHEVIFEEGTLQYEASAKLDTINSRTIVTVNPKHQLDLIPS